MQLLIALERQSAGSRVERFRRRLIALPEVLESSHTFTGTDYVVLAHNTFYFIFPVHKMLNHSKWAATAAACGYGTAG